VTVSPVTAATGAEGRPCASSQTICPWLRATGSWARRSWVASASTPRDAWTESHFGMPSLYMRIWYHTLPSREVARCLAIFPQGPESPADLTVRELVVLGRWPHRCLWHTFDAHLGRWQQPDRRG